MVDLTLGGLLKGSLLVYRSLTEGGLETSRQSTEPYGHAGSAQSRNALGD
ncbi:hypothetical protein NDI52_28415 [Leptolyngbya sp. PL-A3]